MELKTGTAVYGKQGKHVGDISHLVFDGHNMELTHVVISKGWLLPRDIVVPLDAIESLANGEVHLRLDEAHLDQQPDFIEAHYATPDPNDPLPARYGAGSLLYSPVVPPLGVGWYYPGTYAGMPPMPVDTEKNVPEGSVTLTEGLQVWTGDEQVGTIAGVRVHPRSGRVTHIVVSKGWLFPEERLLPAALINTVDDLGVHLATRRDELDTVAHPIRE